MGQMKKYRIQMKGMGGNKYVTTACIVNSNESYVTLNNISGMSPTLQLQVPTSQVLGRKRSGRRGHRSRGRSTCSTHSRTSKITSTNTTRTS